MTDTTVRPDRIKRAQGILARLTIEEKQLVWAEQSVPEGATGFRVFTDLDQGEMIAFTIGERE